jgi:hypothetical protein
MLPFTSHSHTLITLHPCLANPRIRADYAPWCRVEYGRHRSDLDTDGTRD